MYDDDAIGEIHYLVEVRRIENDANSIVASSAKLVANESGRPDIQSPRWILGDDESGILVELSRQNELLLIAAGKRSHGRRRARCPYVESVHESLYPHREP